MTAVLPRDLIRARAVSQSCGRRLSGHGLRTPQQQAAELVDEASRGGDGDDYGAGGVVTDVE